MTLKSATWAAIALSISLVGCATQVVSSKPVKSYTIGQKLNAPVGGVILSAAAGTVSQVRQWVGILNSPDGWQTRQVVSPDYVRKELVYGGMTNGVIEIAYREYRGELAAQAFYQNVRYELAASDVITFQNFKIKVLSATNSGFEGVLLND